MVSSQECTKVYFTHTLNCQNKQKLVKPTHTEAFTTTKDKIDNQSKELLKENHPDAWNECNIELIPRLTIKAF